MARPKKDGKTISILMDRELFERLEKYCSDTYLTKTAAVEKALKKMFDEMEKTNKER